MLTVAWLLCTLTGNRPGSGVIVAVNDSALSSASSSTISAINKYLHLTIFNLKGYLSFRCHVVLFPCMWDKQPYWEYLTPSIEWNRIILRTMLIDTLLNGIGTRVMDMLLNGMVTR